MGFSVFGVGETLWDRLPTGHHLGGAPANFTYHAQQLGANASLITRVGDDFLGKAALKQLREKRVSCALIQIDDEHPTGAVDVTFPSHGIPQYIIHENVAWDHLDATEEALTAISNADALCFGSLSQRNARSCIAIQKILSAAPKNALRVYDINLRQNFYSLETIKKSLELANILKLNCEEMFILAQLFKISGSIEQQVSWLANAYQLQTIALTRGAEGSLLLHQGQWSAEPQRKIHVADTIGAGDAFTAALITGLLNNFEARAAHSFAAEVSGYVCSQQGGMPALPSNLRIKNTQPP